MGDPSSGDQPRSFKILPAEPFPKNIPPEYFDGYNHRVVRKIETKIENPLKIVYKRKNPETRAPFYDANPFQRYPCFQGFGGNFFKSLKVTVGGREVFPRHYPYVEMMEREEKPKENEKEEEEAKTEKKPQKTLKIFPKKRKEKFLPKQKFSKPPKNFCLQQPMRNGYK